MRYYQVIVAYILVLLIMGIFSLISPPYHELPETVGKQGTIIVAYPCEASIKIKKQLKAKIEKKLSTLKKNNIKEIHYCTKEGLVIIYVKLKDNVENTDKFWSKIKLDIQELQMEFSNILLVLSVPDHIPLNH